MEEKREKGRPTKWNKALEAKLVKLAKLGMTDKQLAASVDICEDTLNNWKLEYPDFFESLKKSKVMSDGSVERSLYEKAMGYEHPSTHFSNHMGNVTETPYIKKYAPDTTAQIFWLKNRNPDRWRDKTEVDNNISGGLSVTVEKNTIYSKEDLKQTVRTKTISPTETEVVTETVKTVDCSFDVGDVI
jgi:hypothetical protein